MHLSHRLAGAAAVFAAVLVTAPSALAIPPVGADPIPTCKPTKGCTNFPTDPLPPPPPPAHNPNLTLELARQTTDRSAVRIVGYAADADQPATSLTVQVRIDGALVRTLVADTPRPPVLTQGKVVVLPPIGDPHGYDTTIPTSPSSQTVCVTALNVGGGVNTQVCTSIDRIIEFAANTIGYDVASAQITSSGLESLDRVTNTNATNVQQSTTISGEKTVSESSGWKDEYGVKVTVGAKIKVPLFSELSVSVEGSVKFEQNGSTTTTRKFAWSQPVLVPARSRVVASIAVTKTELTVPYALSGSFVYASGVRLSGTTSGVYTGVNSHDLEVALTQFNLDGTPAAVPVPQPQATFLRASVL